MREEQGTGEVSVTRELASGSDVGVVVEERVGMSQREALHRLVDELADQLIPSAASRLMELRDEADEPVTDEEIAAMEAGRSAYSRGEWVSNEEVRREFGW